MQNALLGGLSRPVALQRELESSALKPVVFMFAMLLAMIRNFAAAFFALAALSTESSAQQTASIERRPVLRAEATVTGDVVRIGDLIDNAGIVADIAIFRAPDLGTTGSVTAAQVADAVRPHAILGLDTAGLREVAVVRTSRTIPSREVEALIANALAAQLAPGATKNIDLRFDQTMRGVRVDAGAAGPPQVATLSFNQRSGRFDVALDLPGTARRRLTGTATVTATVITLARPLGPGEILKSSDLVIERRARSDVPADAVTSLEQVVGLAARNSLGAGRPLRAADVMKPEMVRRNESVTLVYEIPGITLTLRGKASNAGAEGDPIEVLNVQSNRLVQGIIIGPSRVLVTAMSPSVVAEAETKTATSSNAQARAP